MVQEIKLLNKYNIYRQLQLIEGPGLNSKFKLYSLLMGANVETVLYLVSAWYVAEWLDESYPIGFSWSAITFVFALILIGRSWYVMLRIMIKDQKENSGNGEK